jgi:pimeloyl-ACP methyl ester carboxylesterase
MGYTDIDVADEITKINAARENVIVIHGLNCAYNFLRNKYYGKLLQELSKEYNTYFFVWDKDMPLKGIIESLKTFIEDKKIKESHFIMHSFGAVIFRLFYQKPSCRIGKVIMIAPLNNGSRILEYSFRKYPSLAQKVLGKASREFLQKKRSILKMPLPKGMLIVAGTKNFRLGAPEAYMLKMDQKLDLANSDGKIYLDETRAKAMKEHFVIHEYHDLLSSNTKVIAKIKAFLKKPPIYTINMVNVK